MRFIKSICKVIMTNFQDTEYSVGTLQSKTRGRREPSGLDDGWDICRSSTIYALLRYLNLTGGYVLLLAFHTETQDCKRHGHGKELSGLLPLE